MQVVFEGIAQGLLDVEIFVGFLVGPLLVDLVRPPSVLSEALSHGSSWLALFIPYFDQVVRSCREDEPLGGFVDQGDVGDSVAVSSDLQFLADVARRHDIVGLMMAEVVSVGRVLSSPQVIVILDPVWIFIADHLGSHWLDVLVLYEGRDIDDADVAELIAQDQLALDLILVLDLVSRGDERDLGGFLDAVHVLPLGKQLVRIFWQILGGEEINGSLDINDDEDWKRVDK